MSQKASDSRRFFRLSDSAARITQRPSGHLFEFFKRFSHHCFPSSVRFYKYILTQSRRFRSSADEIRAEQKNVAGKIF
jgi:hypothetical protein